MLSGPFMQRCEAFFLLMALLPSPPFLLSVLLGMPQLNLIHSEVSNLAGFDVEGVINPTTAELELKDDLGETPPKSTQITAGSSGKKILECFCSSLCYKTSNIE